MQSYIKWNKGYNFENVVRKIYSKYIFSGSSNMEETEIFYNNYESSINLASSESELEELAGIIDDLLANGKITEKEHNYFINKINEKWRKFW